MFTVSLVKKYCFQIEELSHFMIYGVEDQGDEDFQSFFYQLSNDDEDATLEDYLMFNDNLATWADQVNREAGVIQQPPKH